VLVVNRYSWPVALTWRNGVLASLAVLVLGPLSLLPYATSSTELVRLRNSLLILDSTSASFDWTPENVPPDFLLEQGPVDPVFEDVTKRLSLSEMPSDWERALAISQHILAGNPGLGGAIQSDLRTTYSRLVKYGEGYCGDFNRVFTAFAIAVGIPVRSWAFSFDGFGGHGHVWPEIWNRQLQRWQLIDIFDNNYFTLEDGVPISALELRRAMKESPRALRIVPLFSGARPGYVIEEKAWDYYRRGLPEWYLYAGNNVFTYDRAFLVRAFVNLSRSLEQLGGIAQRVSPGIHILEDADNQKQVSAILLVRQHVLTVGVLAAIALVVLVVCLLGWLVTRCNQSRNAKQW
jgi:hypothetical protein